MIEAAGLLGSAIYEIKEAWTGRDTLQQANYVLRTLPKGLKFFRVVCPSKSSKVMGLVGIHHLDMLWLQGAKPLPLVQKRSQNEGIVINHL